MNSSTQSRTPLRRLIAAKTSSVLCATALLCLATALPAANAQSSCSLTAIENSATLEYPKIAQAARVSGDLNLNAVFGSDGSVISVDVAGGPAMLRKTATDYVSSWRVNDVPSQQECTITISFRVEGSPDCYFNPSVVSMTGLQHFVVTTKGIQTCDPSATITRTRYHFLFVHWHSKPVIHVNE